MALRAIEPSCSFKTHQLPEMLTLVTHCISTLWSLNLQSNNIQLVVLGSLYLLPASMTKNAA